MVIAWKYFLFNCKSFVRNYRCTLVWRIVQLCFRLAISELLRRLEISRTIRCAMLNATCDDTSRIDERNLSNKRFVISKAFWQRSDDRMHAFRSGKSLSRVCFPLVNGYFITKPYVFYRPWSRELMSKIDWIISSETISITILYALVIFYLIEEPRNPFLNNVCISGKRFWKIISRFHM